MKITFFGAAQEVTGSCYRVETEKHKFMVDCGLFQGSKELEQKNHDDIDFNEVEFMLLTHAHIDHTGRIPLLYKNGFRKPIYCTKATKDLAEIMLMDSAKIQESDVEWENRKRQRSGKTLLTPLYTTIDAMSCISLFKGRFYDEVVKINEDIRVVFRDAGHMLGSSSLEIFITENGKTTKIIFSGDIGTSNNPILNNPEVLSGCDYLVMESTYGNRIHEPYKESVHSLIEIIEKVSSRGGTVIIPSFAVGRTQEIIYELNSYYDYQIKDHYEKKVPVYVDSPMALEATKAFMKNTDLFNQKAKDYISSGDNVFEFENLHYVKNIDESKMLNNVKFPRVIISSSGMATAGRVRHHLKHNLWDEKNAVVFVGYQAEGSLGRILLDGIDEVKLFGETIKVNAEIYNLGGFSGHADQNNLMDFVDNMKVKPKKIFITHGENEGAETLSNLLKEKYDIEAVIPEIYSTEEFDAGNYNIEQEISTNRENNDLYEELEKIKKKIDRLYENKELFDHKNMDSEEYNQLNNQILDLKNKIMTINMITGE